MSRFCVIKFPNLDYLNGDAFWLLEDWFVATDKAVPELTAP